MIQMENIIFFSILLCIWVQLMQSKNYTSVSPFWLTSPFMRAGSQDVIATLTEADIDPIYTFIFSYPLSGVPNLVYGIRKYQGIYLLQNKGFDTLREEIFEIRKLALDATSFQVQVDIVGYTSLYNLNVPYLAVDPNFPHHLNSFDNVPINYESTLVIFHNNFQTNITVKTNTTTFYSNDINYTQQATGRPYRTFTSPLQNNKILMYITSLNINGTTGDPVNICVSHSIITTNTYRLSVQVSILVFILKLQFSMIIFNSDDVQNSQKYAIVYYIWETDNLGGFIDVPSAFIDNFILGLTDFSTKDAYCVISYAWSFANVSGQQGVKLGVSQPVVGSIYSCSLSRIRSTIFYMKTWQCPQSNPYFNLTTNLCQDSCGLSFFQNTSVHLCQKCQFACRECVNSTFCTKCDDFNDFRTLINNSGKVSCLCVSRYHQDPLNSTNTVCQPCMTNCLTCQNSTVCEVCDFFAGYVLTADKICKMCGYGCLSCYQLPYKCLTCVTGMIADNAQQKCVCLPGTYSSNLGVSCLACHWTCATCSGPSSTECIQCHNETTFYNAQQKCVCLAGTFNSDSNASCVTCHWTCTKCSGPLSTDCLSCNNETIFYSVQQECLCLDGTYNEDLNQTCLSCHQICETCTGPQSSECITFKRISNEKIENFKEFMDSTFGNPIFSFLNQFPGGRKIAGPLFAFFLNFDDFWLYNYHQRNYSEVIQSLMNKINDMEAQKWSLIQYQKIFDALRFNKDKLQKFLSAKESFTSKKFFDIEDNSNGFFPNTPNFLFSNIFVTLLVFIVMKILHIALKCFKISNSFRQYSFWPFYLLMIIEGNLQYFSYILTFDMMKFFESNYDYKFFSIATLFIVFGTFFVGGFSYFILKFHYGTRTKYLLTDVKSNLIGIVYVSTVIGLRNIFIGASHYFFEQNYQTKIASLISIETIFIGIYFIVLYDKRLSSAIDSKGKIWFCSIFPGLIRIALNFTFLLTYQNTSLEMKLIYIVFTEIQMTLIYCYMGLFMFATSVQILRCLKEIISFLYRKYQHKFNKSQASESSFKRKRKQFKASQPALKVLFDSFIDKNTDHIVKNGFQNIQTMKSPLKPRKVKKNRKIKLKNKYSKKYLETSIFDRI